MIKIVLGCLLIFILIMLIAMTYHFKALANDKKNAPLPNADDEDDDDRIEISHGFIYAAIVLTSIAFLAFIYLVLKGTPYEGHMMEWLNIIVRLMHITFGIAWIGASFYFVFLENALNRTKDVREELAGNLWAVHGGGFYYLEKYKVAPKKIPKELHWFK